MPASRLGQLITFAIDADEDRRFEKWIWVEVTSKDSIQSIAARRGHPEDARAIADANGLRSVRQKFTGGGRAWIKVPGGLRASESFDVLAGDEAPRIVGGYAKLTTLDRPERTGLTVPNGYDPVRMQISIRFTTPPGDRSGIEIMRDIALLERMAGRGNFHGAAVGPPPIIRLSTTNSSGVPVPLIATNYQWTPQNPSAPLWRIDGESLDWDAEPLRNGGGNIIDQKATLIVQQHTKISLQERSLPARAAHKPKRKK